jgi:hypothetical protein
MSTDILASLLEAAELALSQGDSHAARQYIAATRAALTQPEVGEVEG